ncbi:transposase family protein [Cohnella cellulosilytica]|uniref:Transposase family protein n=1 Tax=Cohnella cellulosilytica TaxID=986710 RepID=A0ABW2FD39_9BACL
MQTQYINELLDIPELEIHQLLSIHDDEVHIEAVPLDDKQICPCCASDQAVIRKGSNGMRTVRHLSVFEKKTYLHVPAIRMFCSRCEAGFVWAYHFVGPKQRYSRLFRSHTVEQALGSTAAHSARIQKAPASTIQHIHNEAVPPLCDALYEQVWEEASESFNEENAKKLDTLLNYSPLLRSVWEWKEALHNHVHENDLRCESHSGNTR